MKIRMAINAFSKKMFSRQVFFKMTDLCSLISYAKVLELIKLDFRRRRWKRVCAATARRRGPG